MPQVFSSNFSRTQQSAQGLLHGLGAHELASGGQVPVVVREESACTIHMYDNNPRVIQQEVGKVLTAPSFLARQDQQKVRGRGEVWLLTTHKKRWSYSTDLHECNPRQ